MKHIGVLQLQSWMDDDAELALLDVREHGQYGSGHLFFAVSLPYSVLEVDVPRLVPRKTVRVVVYGDASSGPVVAAYVKRLDDMGYTDVSVLQGGVEGWQQAGGAVFAGVNLPGKTFGELVEHACATPKLSARELHEKLQSGGERVVVLDGRPVAEYRKMNIPGSICCPNAELPLRVSALVTDPQATIVVSCAGRTRSIIGAQTLINFGVPNKVYALENGTQGWFLSGFALEHGSNRTYEQAPIEHARESVASMRQRAARLAREFAVPSVACDEVLGWLRAGEMSVFVCDIRTPEEHARDALPAVVQHAQGGQLIQAIDQYVGVQKSKIVLLDTDGIRAPVVASWLKQMGRDVVLLAEARGLAAWPVPSVPPQGFVTLAQTDLAGFLRARGSGATLFDARSSQAFRKAHVRGAKWLIRPMLLEKDAVSVRNVVVLLGDSAPKLALLSDDLRRRGVESVYGCLVDPVFPGHLGLDVLRDGQVPPDAECIDYLFFVHDRHDGNTEAARRYLQWETSLVSQLSGAELRRFSVNQRVPAA